MTATVPDHSDQLFVEYVIKHAVARHDDDVPFHRFKRVLLRALVRIVRVRAQRHVSQLERTVKIMLTRGAFKNHLPSSDNLKPAIADVRGAQLPALINLHHAQRGRPG